jgi:hypothetical protein
VIRQKWFRFAWVASFVAGLGETLAPSCPAPSHLSTTLLLLETSCQNLMCAPKEGDSRAFARNGAVTWAVRVLGSHGDGTTVGHGGNTTLPRTRSSGGGRG